MHRLDLKKRDWRDYEREEREQWGDHFRLFLYFVQGQMYSPYEEYWSALEIRNGQPVYVVYGRVETVFALPRWTVPHVEAYIKAWEAWQAEEERRPKMTWEEMLATIKFQPVETPLVNLIPRTPAQGVPLHAFKSITTWEPKEQVDA